MQGICKTVALCYLYAFCIKIVVVIALCLLSEEDTMFQIKPDRKETENKTVRFPVELIDKIEKALVGKNATFSAFVIQACEYALDNMEIKEKKKVKS